MSSIANFREILAPILEMVRGRALDAALEQDLRKAFPPDSPAFEAIREACRSGCNEGWMGLEGDRQRKGGRVIDPGPATAGSSVDVVEIADITGPHHSHPNGEICAVFAVTPWASFDGHFEGWTVYPPGSAHWPSARGGRVRVMFFLPDGAIDYTDTSASLGSGSGK